MIAYIKGTIMFRDQDHIIIENNDIGYHIFFPSIYPAEIGEKIKIFTYQHVREDSNDLFGFITQHQRNTFLKLISVKGVGPKTALNIMASIDVDELITAISTEDLTKLKKLPGIGPKSAKQMVLDLKGKLPQVQSSQTKLNTDLQDALEGLKQLGYSSQELQPVEHQLKKKVNLDAEGYLKEGLKILAKRRG